MYCLDSDFLIEVLRGSERARPLMEKLVSDGSLFTSAITAFEITDVPQPIQREKALALLLTTEILPVEGSTAMAASGLSQKLARQGEPVPRSDLLIAATCLLKDLTLVTRKTRHFGRVPRLRMRTW